MPLHCPKEKEKKRKIKIISVQAFHNRKNLEDNIRAHIYNMVALSRK